MTVVVRHRPGGALTAAPWKSTAKQNDVDGHDTEPKPPPVTSTDVGLPHDLPLKVNALPLPSTATQNYNDTQNTELRRETINVAGTAWPPRPQPGPPASTRRSPLHP